MLLEGQVYVITEGTFCKHLPLLINIHSNPTITNHLGYAKNLL